MQTYRCLDCGKVFSGLQLQIGYSKHDTDRRYPEKACPCGSIHIKEEERS